MPTTTRSTALTTHASALSECFDAALWWRSIAPCSDSRVAATWGPDSCLLVPAQPPLVGRGLRSRRPPAVGSCVISCSRVALIGGSWLAWCTAVSGPATGESRWQGGIPCGDAHTVLFHAPLTWPGGANSLEPTHRPPGRYLSSTGGGRGTAYGRPSVVQSARQA